MSIELADIDIEILNDDSFSYEYMHTLRESYFIFNNYNNNKSSNICKHCACLISLELFIDNYLKYFPNLTTIIIRNMLKSQYTSQFIHRRWHSSTVILFFNASIYFITILNIMLSNFIIIYF